VASRVGNTSATTSGSESALPVGQQEVFGPVQVAQRFGSEDEIRSYG
jgi:hypothetical protein